MTKKKIAWGLTAVSALLALLGAAFRTHMLATAYFPADGFYTNTVQHNILRGTLVLFVILSYAAAHIYIKEGNFHPKGTKVPALVIASTAVAIVFGGFVLFTAVRFLLHGRYGAPVADLVMAGVALISLLYYLGEEKAGKKNEIRSVLCISSALVLLAMVFGLYFNGSVSFVNHSVMLAFAAAIFTMLATTAEANVALGRPTDARYFSYAPAAVAMTFTCAVPDIIYYFTAKVTVLTNLYYDLLLLILGFYHLIRLVTSCFAGED